MTLLVWRTQGMANALCYARPVRSLAETSLTIGKMRRKKHGLCKFYLYLHVTDDFQLAIWSFSSYQC